MRVKDITDYIDKNEYYEVVVKFVDECGDTFKQFCFQRGEEDIYDEFEFYDIANMHVSRLDTGKCFQSDSYIRIHVFETVYDSIF